MYRNIFLFLFLASSSTLSFSQEDDSMTLLKDADDAIIKFENHYFEALKYKAIGNYTRAITELEKCEQLKANNKAVAFELSKNYLALNKPNEAQLYIKQSLKNDSKNSWLLEHAKKIYLKQYDFSNAIKVQQQLVALNPKKKEGLVYVYIKAKKYKEAQKIVEELEQHQQTSSKLSYYKRIIAAHYSKKTIIYEVKSDAKTLETLKENYKNIKIFNVLKEILDKQMQQGNYKEALTFSNDGLVLFPAQPSVYLKNAQALMHFEKYEQAIETLTNGIDFVIDTKMEINFYKQLFICYTKTNHQIEAQKIQKKLIKLKEKQ